MLSHSSPLSGRPTAVALSVLLFLLQWKCTVTGHRRPGHNSNTETGKRQGTQEGLSRVGALRGRRGETAGNVSQRQLFRRGCLLPPFKTPLTQITC